MKYVRCFIISLLFALPIIVNAYNREEIDISVDMCKSGCEYDNFTDVFNYAASQISFDDLCIYSDNTTVKFVNLTINIKDNEDYDFNDYQYVYQCGAFTTATRENYIENIKIIGQGNNLFIKTFDPFGGSLYLENLNFIPKNQDNNSITVEGGTTFKRDSLDVVPKSYFNNCDFSQIDLSVLGNVNLEINNSKIGNLAAVSKQDSYWYNSTSMERTVDLNPNIVIKNTKFINSGFKRVSEIPKDSNFSYIKTNCVAEDSCSKITIYDSQEYSLKLNSDSKYNIKDLINVDQLDASKLNYDVLDDSIIKIENNVIVPLKVGSTVLNIAYGDDNYQFKINVLKENPKTSNDEIVNVPDTALQKGKKLIAIGIVFLIVGLSMQLLVFKKVISKNSK